MRIRLNSFLMMVVALPKCKADERLANAFKPETFKGNEI